MGKARCNRPDPWRWALAGLMALAVSYGPPALAATTRTMTLETINVLASETANKMLTSAVFQAKAQGQRKARVVLGDVRNMSDDEGAQVKDINDEIRNRIVAAGTTRIFDYGNLDSDFIISPELSSAWSVTSAGRKHCFTLQLTLTTPQGEYAAAFSAQRCS